MAAAETDTPTRRPSLFAPRSWLKLASPAIALVFAVLAIWRGFDYAHNAYTEDVEDFTNFQYLVNAARVITSDEPGLLYDDDFDADEARRTRWRIDNAYPFPNFYPYAPLVPLLTSVAVPFNEDTQESLWRVAVAASSIVLGICVASAFRGLAWKLAIIVAVVMWHPVLTNARSCMYGAFFAAATGVFLLAYLRNHKLGAVLFGLLAIKPVAAIGPGLIVLQEKPGVWLRFGLSAAFFTLAPFLWLGLPALLRWIEVLTDRGWNNLDGGVSYNQGLTSFLGASNLLTVVLAVVLFGLVVLIVRLVHGSLGVYAGMAFAIFAGCLVNPHSLFYDWGTAFLGIFLLRKANLVPESMSDLALGLLAISLFLAGQYTWQARFDEGQFLRPLTAWTIAMCGSLFLLSLLRLPAVSSRLRLSQAAAGPAPQEA